MYRFFLSLYSRNLWFLYVNGHHLWFRFVCFGESQIPIIRRCSTLQYWGLSTFKHFRHLNFPSLGGLTTTQKYSQICWMNFSVSSSLKASNFFVANGNSGSCTRSNHYPHRLQLEQDVQRLQQQFQEELEIRSVLENAIKNNVFALSCATSIPAEVQDLLSTLSVLEVTVSKLEQQIISWHFHLSQERNERKLAEYHLRQSANHSMSASSSELTQSTVLSSSGHLDHSDSEVCNSNELASMKNHRLESNAEASCAEHLMKVQEKTLAILHEKNSTGKTSMEHGKVAEVKKLPRSMPPKGLWDHPNQLSEEMVRCMQNIFMSLADSAVPSKSSTPEGQSSPVSPQGHLSNSSWRSFSEKSLISSWVHSPEVDVQRNAEVLAVENVFDPYRVRGKLSWAKIGNYSLATEVSWMSVGKKQLEYTSGALRRFRILVELLAKVNPIHLNDDEKLAFWINLYNALLMHAYLAYGVPKSDLKLFSLMQKAAYTVGGSSFSATAIEYVILKMKPPLHRSQIALLLALRKLKVSEEQRKSAVDSCEPLVAFALSCGMYSSPAVKIYTAKNVREELQDVQHGFIRASVGVSNKGKLLVPKMLHCFAKSSVDDSDLAVWISRYLPSQQAAFVEQCLSQRRQSVLNSHNCGILPFDPRFRYLFLPEKTSL